MNMTVTFGWWVIPLAITLGTMSWAILTPGAPMRGDYSFPDPMPAIRFAGALIVSLVAWLIWALAA
jgi:hypothetical protein